jgi:microcystin-dependent protein
MPIIAYRAKQSTDTAGTGTLVLNGASSNARSFQGAFGAATRRIQYCISWQTGFEIGLGDFDGGSPGSLTRATILASSNSGGLVALPAGTKDVFSVVDPAAREVITIAATANLALADIGNTVVFSGAAAATLNLPAVAAVPLGAGWLVTNLGSAPLTIDPNASETINGQATIALQQGMTANILRLAASQWAASIYGHGRLIGEYVQVAGPNLPPLCVWPNGQNLLRSNYAALFAAIGTTYGAGDGSTSFGTPDVRGRAFFGLDNLGGTAASRITSAVAGLNGGLLGAAGGSQLSGNTALTEAQMPSHAHSGTTSLNGDHQHGTAGQGGQGGGINSVGNFGSSNNYILTGGGTDQYFTSTAGNHQHSFSTSLTGGGQPHNHTAIPPAIMCTVALYAGA